MKENIIQKKSYDFALKIVLLCRRITAEKKEYVLTKQLIRSGTSIGANVEEAIGGQSKNDFLSKLSIAYKEARETQYWIKLLTGIRCITPVESSVLLNEIEEILRIIGKIQKTTRSNINS